MSGDASCLSISQIFECFAVLRLEGLISGEHVIGLWLNPLKMNPDFVAQYNSLPFGVFGGYGDGNRVTDFDNFLSYNFHNFMLAHILEHYNIIIILYERA